jgi:hypothetical protein
VELSNENFQRRRKMEEVSCPEERSEFGMTGRCKGK